MKPDSSSDEETLLSKKPRASQESGLASIDLKDLKWKRKDVCLVMYLSFLNFGDTVELYLPGVITQSASEELGVSQTQEGMLGIILYLSLTLSLLVSTAIKNRYCVVNIFTLLSLI